MAARNAGTGLCRILIDTFVDAHLTNAQMGNAREIIRRLDPARFHVTTFHLNEPLDAIAARPNTTLIRLPERRQTARILREFISGKHHVLFYLKASPASKLYLRLRGAWPDNRIVIGTVESRSDLRNEPTIAPEAVQLWEQTVLRADYLYSNSVAVMQSLQSEYGLSSEVVPTGVDTRFFIPDWDRPRNQRPRVLFVGSLRGFKQPQLVLSAAARFPDADFVLVGDGVLARELRERVQSEHLANVTMTGVLRADALREQYQQADVFLFPSVWEGSPKVILEAAACGLPVIARRNYEPETVAHGETGYLVRSDDELFACLGLLLTEPELRRGLGHNGRRHSYKFDWDIITRQWEEIFWRLAQRE